MQIELMCDFGQVTSQWRPHLEWTPVFVAICCDWKCEIISCSIIQYFYSEKIKIPPDFISHNSKYVKIIVPWFDHFESPYYSALILGGFEPLVSCFRDRIWGLCQTAAVLVGVFILFFVCNNYSWVNETNSLERMIWLIVLKAKNTTIFFQIAHDLEPWYH